MLFFLAGICFQSLITGNSGVILLTRMLFGTWQYILDETASVNLWVYYCLLIQNDTYYFIFSFVLPTHSAALTSFYSYFIFFFTFTAYFHLSFLLFILLTFTIFQIFEVIY
jgi:hypothetical protein